MRKTERITTVFIVAIIGVTLWLWVSPAGIKQAPNVTFNLLDGRKIQTQALRGKPVLVTFWATTCSGCLKEMPHLVELYRELGTKRFEIIGVAMSYDPPNQVLELVTERRIPYPVSLDIDGAIAMAFGNVMLTPTSFLIAPDGRIIKHKIGEMDIADLKLAIKNLPSQPPYLATGQPKQQHRLKS